MSKYQNVPSFVQPPAPVSKSKSRKPISQKPPRGYGIKSKTSDWSFSGVSSVGLHVGHDKTIVYPAQKEPVGTTRTAPAISPRNPYGKW